MKIAYVYDAVYPYQIGGVEKRIFELGRRLAARGHDVHVYGLKTWNGDSSFRKDGIRYHGVGHPLPFYVNGRRSVSEAVHFGLAALPPLLREHFDIIDCQNFPYSGCFSSAMASGIHRIPLIVTWHEVWGDYWYDYLGRLGFFGKLTEKMTLRLSEHVIAVSRMTKNNLSFRISPEKIAVISNGIDLQKINAIPASDQISDIFFTGRLVKEKKADILIKAVKIIKKTFPDIRVVIAGDGPEKDHLRRLAQQHEVDTNIRFLGFVRSNEELLGLMKASKIFTSPSIREGFGMAALEAQACGLPVVTSNSSENAVKDLVDYNTGIISDLIPEEFAESILECLQRKAMMTGDCEKVVLPYDWDTIVPEIEEYYEGVSR
jgi:L-malate glycosyltransferase